jgi:hypothetical protein
MKLFVLAALALGGCNLVNANTFSIDYAFDPQEYQKSFGNAQGTIPQVACDSSNDQCAQDTQALLQGSSLTASCDAGSMECRASAELRLSYPVDLSSQSSFPPEAVQYGINFVHIKSVRYWVASNSLSVATPPIDLYVAPASAKDESGGTRLGSVAPLGARSAACTDTVDKDGDPNAGTAMVCDLALDSAGTAALANFAKDYKNEFQIIAHAVVSAKGGDPVPSGSIDFVVRPVIQIGILK